MTSWSSERGRCRRFTLAGMKKATNSFNDVTHFLGRGGEGVVYKGVLADGRSQVAVKRLKPQLTSGQRELGSFEKEIKMLSKFHHANLLTLIGYCQEAGENILVYEFMSNGNLCEKLNNIFCPLSYEQRLIICIGVACAIEYLHTGTSLDSKIIHRDVKPDNILLDKNMAGKISDFGLCKASPVNQTHSSVTATHLCGTRGYFAPEYLETGKFTWRVDVYAFGVVLIEVMCKKKPWERDNSNNEHKVAESYSKWAQRNLDPILEGTVSRSSLETFTNIAEKCFSRDQYQRPTMSQVVGILDSALKLQKHDDDGGSSSKSASTGEKRQVDSESSSDKSAKVKKTSSKISISTIPESTKVSLYSTKASEETMPRQESRASSSSHPSGQVGKVLENFRDAGDQLEGTNITISSASAASPSALPDVPGTENKVVLYKTGDITDYMKVLLYLNKIGVDFEQRDTTANKQYEVELRQFFTRKQEEYSLPQLFVGGKHIGGAKEVVRLHDSGELGEYLAVYQH